MGPNTLEFPWGRPHCPGLAEIKKMGQINENCSHYCVDTILVYYNTKNIFNENPLDYIHIFYKYCCDSKMNI